VAGCLSVLIGLPPGSCASALALFPTSTGVGISTLRRSFNHFALFLAVQYVQKPSFASEQFGCSKVAGLSAKHFLMSAFAFSQ